MFNLESSRLGSQQQYFLDDLDMSQIMQHSIIASEISMNQRQTLEQFFSCLGLLRPEVRKAFNVATTRLTSLRHYCWMVR